jgi:hypothetical protein
VTDFKDAMRAAVRGHLTAIYSPALERKVWIRQLSVEEALRIENEEPDLKMRGLRITAAAIVNEEGEREIVTDEDFQLFMNLPLAVVIPLLLESGKQNGQTAEEIKEAVEAFVKAPEQPSSTD